MNAKQAKALRRVARAAGYQPTDGERTAGRDRVGGLQQVREVLQPNSGRAVYKNLKRIASK